MANNESLDEQQNYEATAKKDEKRCVVTFSRLCDNFFDVLNPRALCYHTCIAICIAAMQSTKPTHSEKLPGTQGVVNYTTWGFFQLLNCDSF